MCAKDGKNRQNADKMIKAVFLDIDNTLLSFSEYVKESMRDGFERFGLKPYTEDMYPVFERINTHFWEHIEQGELTYEELLKIRWNTIFAELGIDFDGETFEEYFKGYLFSSAVPVPHAMELLEYLHGRYVLCVVSNGPYEQQLNRLRVGGMDGFFEHFFISSQIGASKPDSAFFDHCFAALRKTDLPDLRPEETIIIGDSMTSDITGGAEYGMHTCLYRPGGDGTDIASGKDPSDENMIVADRPAGSVSGPDYIVRSLLGIKDIL